MSRMISREAWFLLSSLLVALAATLLACSQPAEAPPPPTSAPATAAARATQPPSLPQPLADLIAFAGATVEPLPDDSSVVRARFDVPCVLHDGSPGAARLALTFDPGRAEPAGLLLHCLYAMPDRAAGEWARRGWIVLSVQDLPVGADYQQFLAPVDGLNIARAAALWARRAPVLRQLPLVLDGESQGAAVALALSREAPVAGVVGRAPLVNWPCFLNAIDRNRAHVVLPPGDWRESAVPMIGPAVYLVDGIALHVGQRLDDRAWLDASPLAWAREVDAPVLLIHATGDIITPIETVLRLPAAAAFDPAAFPALYARAPEDVAPFPEAARALVDVLPAEQVWSAIVPRPADAYEDLPDYAWSLAERPGPEPAFVDAPFSPDHRWSIAMLDDGAPSPRAAHRRHRWAVEPFAFAAHAAAIPPRAIDAAMLARLLDRWEGIEHEPLSRPDGSPITRRQADALERLDVLSILLDAADRDALQETYRAQPRRPLGEALDFDDLAARRRALAQDWPLAREENLLLEYLLP